MLYCGHTFSTSMRNKYALKKVIKFNFIATFVLIGLTGIGNQNGPPTGQTGAPGESNCTSCHTGSPITSGANWNNVTFSSNIPACGYTPGQSYAITLSHTQSGISKFGFQLTALTSTTTAAGSFTAGTGNSVSSAGGRTYVGHSISGTSGSGSIAWTFTWVAPSTGVGAVTFYSSVNATNSNNQSTGDEIYVKSFTAPQVGGPPTAVITGPSTPVCAGDTVSFSGSGCSNPTGYSWAFGSVATPSTSNLQAPKVVYNVAGTFTLSLQATNGSGASPFTSRQITVLARPSATITPSGNITLCGSDSVVLSAPSGSGLSYLWSPGGETTRAITVKNSGAFRVTVTNASNCSAMSTNSIVVKRNLPVATIGSNVDTVCKGDTVTFTGNGAFATYRFIRDTQTVQNLASPVYKTTTLNTAHVMKLIATDSSGCTSLPSNGKSVIVKTRLPAPTVACGANTSSTVLFNWSAVTGADGYEISVDSGNTWSMPSSGVNGLSHMISGLPGGIFVQLRTRALQASGVCAYGDAQVFTCQTQGCPKVSFLTSGSAYACLSSDVDTATRIFSISNITAVKYAVNISNTGYSSSLNKALQFVKGTNLVNVKIIDSMNIGCSILDSTLTVTGVNTPATRPALSFSSSGLDTTMQFCDNSFHTLFSTQPGGSNYFTFINHLADTMQEGTVPVFSSMASPIKYMNNDMAYVIAMDTVTGCAKVSLPLTVRLLHAPGAGFNQEAVGTTVSFIDTSIGRIKSWSWLFGSGAGNSQLQDPVFAYPAAGTYTVQLSVTDSNTCVDSVSRQLLLFTTGLAAVGKFPVLRLYPNPAASVITITAGECFSPADLSFVDMAGRTITIAGRTATGLPSGETIIDVSELVTGPYMLVLRTAGQTHMVRFSKL